MFTTYSKKVALAKLYETDFDVHIKTRCSFDHNNFIAERFSQFCGNWAGFYCDEVAIFASTATLELVPHTKWTPRLLLLYDKSSPFAYGYIFRYCEFSNIRKWSQWQNFPRWKADIGNYIKHWTQFIPWMKRISIFITEYEVFQPFSPWILLMLLITRRLVHRTRKNIIKFTKAFHFPIHNILIEIFNSIFNEFRFGIIRSTGEIEK